MYEFPDNDQRTAEVINAVLVPVVYKLRHETLIINGYFTDGCNATKTNIYRQVGIYVIMNLLHPPGDLKVYNFTGNFF